MGFRESACELMLSPSPHETQLSTHDLREQPFTCCTESESSLWHWRKKPHLESVLRNEKVYVHVHVVRVISDGPLTELLFISGCSDGKQNERLTLCCNKTEKDDRLSRSHSDMLYIARPWLQRHIVHRDQSTHTLDKRGYRKVWRRPFDILT